MGRKRYFCEYCQKGFLDDLAARKKHLTSKFHQKNKESYYKSFRDAKTILEEESRKNVCKRHRQYRDCAFGNNCIFTHLFDHDFARLRQIVFEKEKNKFSLNEPEPQLSSWLQKRSNINLPIKPTNETSDIIWSPPNSLLNMGIYLPKSLQPVTLQDFKNVTFNDWG